MFILLILIPGYLLSRIIFEDLDGFLIPPISFVLGLLLLVLAALPSYIFSLTFLQSSAIILTYLGVLLLATLIKGNLTSVNWPKPNFNIALLLLLVFGILIIMFFISPHFDGDALFHLGQIRKLAENSPVSPTEAFFPIEKINPGYSYNIWYFAIAIVAALSKTDVVLVWSHLVFILVPTSVLAFYSFALALFRDRTLAAISVIFYAFFIGFLANAWEFRIAPYPDQVARHIVLYVSFFCFMQFAVFKERRYLYFTILIGALLPMIHMYSWIHLLISVSAFSIASYFLSDRRVLKMGIKVVLAILLLSAPYLLLKLQNAGEVVGDVTLKRDALVLLDRIFIVNPFYGIYALLLFTIFALVFLLYHYRRNLKSKIWLVFVASNAAASFLILYNPIAAPLVSKLITYTYFHRLGYLVYNELIIAAFLVLIVFSTGDKFKLTPQLRSLFLISSLSMIMLIPLVYNKTKETTVNEKEVSELISYIKTKVPKKSVIAADLWTSYRIPAYSNNYIVATFPSHMTANVNGAKRISDLKIIFSPDTNYKQARRVLNSYNVSYVVVNNRPSPNDIFAVDKFEGKGYIRKLYSNGVYTLYFHKIK